jgi:hypothetical protein
VKKAWKWALVVAALPVACIALLWIDSYYRAVAAIRAEDERLARDIAAARSRRAGPQDPTFPLEAGHSGERGARLALYVLSMREFKSTSPRAILSDLAALRSRMSEGGYGTQLFRRAVEIGDLSRLREVLENSTIQELELRRISKALDQLEATRPTIEQCIFDEYLLDRAEVLRVIHRKEDPYGMILRPPGWRDFFSWRILTAKTLRELDDHYREIQEALAQGTLPAVALGVWNEEAGVRSRTQLRIDAPTALGQERQLTKVWEQTRRALESAR